MRYKLAVLGFIMLVGNAAAISTQKVDLATSGGTADDTVTITRSDSDEMVFKDADTGATYSLATLAANGASDHGALTGLTDDDHTAYYNWTRLHDKFGAENTATSVTTGTAFTKWIAVSTDPAGNTSLGNHTTSTLIHYYRPAYVVSVSKSVTGRAGEYSTIQAAINSITDSSTSKRYVVLIHPGTYAETVTLDEEYVSLLGVDRDACRIDDGSLGALSITASAPGIIANLTFMGEQGTAIVTDASAASEFINCRFWGDGTGRATAYSRTAGATIVFRDCIFSEDGSSGADSFSIQHSGAGGGDTGLYYLYNCQLDTQKADHVFCYVPAAATTGVSMYCNDFWVDDDLSQNSATQGLFRFQTVSSVYLYNANFKEDAVPINPNSTAGTVLYAGVQAQDWGSPASGLTTSAIALAGATFNYDVNLASGARLLVGGTETISEGRDATFDEITATSITVTEMTVSGAQDDLRVTNIQLTTSTQAQEYDNTMSKIRSTSDTIVLDPNMNSTAGSGSKIVELTQNTKLAIPDGTSSGPFIRTISASDSINLEASNNEVQEATYIDHQTGNATLYFDPGIPVRWANAAVVIDRCTIYYTEDGAADDEIATVAWVSYDMDNAASATTMASHGALADAGTSHQWLNTDLTLDEDYWYRIRVTTSYNNGGIAVYGFKIEWHTAE